MDKCENFVSSSAGGDVGEEVCTWVGICSEVQSMSQPEVEAQGNSVSVPSIGGVGTSIGMDTSLEADDFILCPLCKTAVNAAPESACAAASKIASVDMDKCENFVSSSAGGDVGEEVCSFVGIC